MNFIILNKYKRERDSDLTTTGYRVVEKTENNPNFPDLPAAHAELKKLLPDYHNAIVTAKGRDKEMVAVKKAKKAAVVALLTEMAEYITLTCKGDEAMLLSSGFEISGQQNKSLCRPLKNWK
ncbi:hypothetical protein [Longitalea luteola]|uniref:hypothetical protein n=1 Tax=Longitalea luteola TaxID=2812563 RepID=UPI001F615337|nr:hypothetical protein [Longitalea luteola]